MYVYFPLPAFARFLACGNVFCLLLACRSSKDLGILVCILRLWFGRGLSILGEADIHLVCFYPVGVKWASFYEFLLYAFSLSAHFTVRDFSHDLDISFVFLEWQKFVTLVFFSLWNLSTKNTGCYLLIWSVAIWSPSTERWSQISLSLSFQLSCWCQGQWFSWKDQWQSFYSDCICFLAVN